LAVYCNAVAPKICAACRCWYSNDGDGLDSVGAVALADILEAEIKAGRTATYAALEHPQREPTPGDIFAEAPRAPRAPNPFVENVDSFAVFLRRSGGFEIW